MKIDSGSVNQLMLVKIKSKKVPPAQPDPQVDPELVDDGELDVEKDETKKNDSGIGN